ncbi:hypothetical protein SSPS47_16155 [Streptomyces sp. S4.7]|uniref:hypothetical protein n=1 Tax=Streptomyces sp. S4.7 TaxID=2705439 RepID=UPI0013977B6E|nr:hypothetical protein [Streptomyces sp. S4.7]QHY96641.1 hypothetical protein SSPS47_16155 [Streptomyces sp. S4.7]
MTDTSTEAVAAPAAAPPPTSDKTPETTPAPAPAADQSGHTAGGWPVVPLAMTGANSTAGLIATAALTGGPMAAAVAATGAAVLGTVAATRTARQSRTGRKANQLRRKAGSASGATPRRTGAGGLGGVPAQSRRAGSPGAGGGRGKTSGLMSRSGGIAAGPKSRTGKGKHAAGASAGGRAGRSPLGSGRTSAGRLGQVKALRQAQKQQAPTRAAARTQATDARRKVADARRAAKAAARTARSVSKGGIGRAVSKGIGRAGRMRDAAVRAVRAARDRNAQQKVDGKRDALRKAKARRRARSALRRSALRMHGRRMLAAALAAPLGVLGMLTTPLGRKLGWRWLMHPGRHLYRRMTGAARTDRDARDHAIREALAEEEAALDAAASSEDDVIGDRVQRPAQLIPGIPAAFPEVVNVSGFRFEEAASEMENAARSYAPDDAMEILAMVENLPEALTCVANTFRILAERSDSEFPLEKTVADGFDDLFQVLMHAVNTAGDLGPLFRQAHEQDIARHEDPRNGPEAEKGWNV